MNTEQPTPQHDHSQDTPDGEGPCLHCMLSDAYEKWIEVQPGKTVDPEETGYSIGQFFAESLNGIIDNGTHEQVQDFIGQFHAAQVDTARIRAAEDEQAAAAAAAEPVTAPNPDTKH